MFLMIGINQGRKDLSSDQLVICSQCGQYGRYQAFMTFTQLLLFFYSSIDLRNPAVGNDQLLFYSDKFLVFTSAILFRGSKLFLQFCRLPV